MQRIPLTQGQVALVDDGDYDWLNQWKWCADKSMSGTYYARRNPSVSGNTQHPTSMAREILGLKYEDPRHSDHINHNTLDNRRENLRVCTIHQNKMNQQPQRNRSSVYKGVVWRERSKKWEVNICIKGVQKYLGLHKIEEVAALVYNLAAIKYYGEEFAYLNFNSRNSHGN